MSTLPNWAEKTIEWFGGFALIAASVFLIPPATSLIAGLYLDDIAAEVERTYYPTDAPGHELGTGTALAMSLRFFLVILAVNLLALFLLLIPGVNLIAFYVGNGYLLGREYFEMVAMRHLPPEAAQVVTQSQPRDGTAVRVRNRGARLGADPEPHHATLRHGVHGAHVQAAEARRSSVN